MDPLSVAISVVSLGTAIGKAAMAISNFISDVKDAKGDLERVSRELSSLESSIETLTTLNKSPALKALNVSQELKHNLYTVLRACKSNVTEIERLLLKLRSSGTRGKLEWTTSGKGEMNKLRSSLETNKMSLGLALSMINL